MASLMLVAAIVFTFGAVTSLTRTDLPALSGAFLLVTFGGLGLSSAYLGVRLLLLKARIGRFMTTHAKRVASYCLAVMGMLDIVTSVIAGAHELLPSGFFLLLLARWMYVLSKREQGGPSL